MRRIRTLSPVGSNVAVEPPCRNHPDVCRPRASPIDHGAGIGLVGDPAKAASMMSSRQECRRRKPAAQMAAA